MSVLTINRTSRVRIDLLSATEAPLGTLDGEYSGSVAYTSAKSVHGSASLTVVDKGQVIDWKTVRVRPVLTVDGYGDTRLGVFLAGEAPEQYDAVTKTWQVKLLDKCTVPDQIKIKTTYALDAGTVVTDAIADLIESTGETNYAVTPNPATLANGIVWYPDGTTVLQIINDLLGIINYFSLFCNGDGQYRAEPYVKPAQRPTVWDFYDGEDCIYMPTFTKDVDLFIPNEFTASTQGDGTAEGLTSTATNDDPSSPWSTVRRGRTISAEPENGLEIADQGTLDAYAERRLIELTSLSSSVDIAHGFVPGLSFNHAVNFRSVPADIYGRHVVQKTEISLDPTQLVKSTLTAVVDL